MLEISRLLISSKCFVPDHTIIFIAFDAEEEGGVGAQQFINSIVVPFYKRQGVNIQVNLLYPPAGFITFVKSSCQIVIEEDRNKPSKRRSFLH